MPDVYGPFDTVTWTQAQWFRHAYRDLFGVFGSAFGTSSAGELGLTVSGLTVTMALGRAWLRGAGYERTGTAWSYTCPANTDPANSRIDRLVLRRDLAAKTVGPVVLQGTPAASPAVPAHTRVEDGVWDLPLHRWTVPPASGAPVTGVVDERIPADLAALAAAHLTDSDWQPITVGGAYTANGTPAVRKVGKRVEANAGIVGTGLAATTTYTNVMTVPTGYRPDRTKYGWAATSTVASIGRFVINTDGTVDLQTGAAVSGYYRLDPITWLTA